MTYWELRNEYDRANARYDDLAASIAYDAILDYKAKYSVPIQEAHVEPEPEPEPRVQITVKCDICGAEEKDDYHFYTQYFNHKKYKCCGEKCLKVIQRWRDEQQLEYEEMLLKQDDRLCVQQNRESIIRTIKLLKKKLNK